MYLVIILSHPLSHTHTHPHTVHTSFFADIIPCGAGWNFDGLKFFDSLYFGRKLSAVVHSKNVEKCSYGVFLLDNSVSLGQKLVTNGFAKYETVETE